VVKYIQEKSSGGPMTQHWSSPTEHEVTADECADACRLSPVAEIGRDPREDTASDTKAVSHFNKKAWLIISKTALIQTASQ